MGRAPSGSSPSGVPGVSCGPTRRSQPRRCSLVAASVFIALAFLSQSPSSRDLAVPSPPSPVFFAGPSRPVCPVFHDPRLSASSSSTNSSAPVLSMSKAALSWPLSFLGVSASLNLHPSVPDYVIAAVRDRMMVDHDQLLPKQVAMPVCDSLSGPLCPHLSTPRVVRRETSASFSESSRPPEKSQDAVFAAAPSTSPPGEAFPQNPDFYYAYVHRVPLRLPVSPPSRDDYPDRSSPPSAVADSGAGAVTSPTSSPSLASSLLSFAASFFSASRDEAPAANSSAFDGRPTPSTDAAVSPFVDWRFSFISRERPKLCPQALKHHPERFYSTRGEFLENAIGDVSSSTAVSEAIASAIGQIGLGRKTLDDIWLSLPLGSLPAPGRSPAAAHAVESSALPDSAAEAQRFVCFVKKRGRSDRNACALAAEFPELPPSLLPTVEPFPRSWVATSHILTFDKSTAPFAQPFLETDYASGLPADAETHWEGIWEVLPVTYEDSASERGRQGGLGTAFASPAWEDLAGSPATIPPSPPRFYGRGDPALFREDEETEPGETESTPDALQDKRSPSAPSSPSAASSPSVPSSPPAPSSPSSSSSPSASAVPLPRRRRPPQPLNTVAVLSSAEGTFEHGTSFVVSSIWIQAVRNPSESRALQRLLPRLLFVVSGIHEDKEVFSAQIPLTFLASRTDLALPRPQSAVPSEEPAEFAFVNLLDFLPYTVTPWTRVEALKFRYALRPPAPSLHGSPANAPGLRAGSTARGATLEPLLASTVSQIAYKVGVGGLVVHVAQRSNGVRTVYYVDRKSPEGAAMLRFFEAKSARLARDGERTGRPEGPAKTQRRSEDADAPEGSLGLPTLLFGDDAQPPRDRSEGEDPSVDGAFREAVGDAESGGKKFATDTDLDLKPKGERGLQLTREKVKRAIRNVVLDILRPALDPKVYRRVLSSMAPLSPRAPEKLQPLKTLAATLPSSRAAAEDKEEAEDGLVYAAVMRTHGDGSGEFLWQQAGDSSAGAAAYADEVRRQKRRQQRQSGSAAREKEESEKEKGENDDLGLVRIGDEFGKVVLTAGTNSSVGTTGGSNRRLPLAKYDNLNNSLVDLRLPAKSVGVYIQEVPVEAPLLSFSQADSLGLVFWRRIGFDTEGKYRDSTANVSGALLADVKSAVSQALQSLGAKTKDGSRASPDGASGKPSADDKKGKDGEKTGGKAGQKGKEASKATSSVKGVLDTILSIYSSIQDQLSDAGKRGTGRRSSSRASTPPADPAATEARKDEQRKSPSPVPGTKPAHADANPHSRLHTLSASGGNSLPSSATTTPELAEAASSGGLASVETPDGRGLPSPANAVGDPGTGSFHASSPGDAGTGALPPRSPNDPLHLSPGSGGKGRGAGVGQPEAFSFSVTDLNKATSQHAEAKKKDDRKGTKNEKPAPETEKKGNGRGKGANEQPFALGFIVGPDNQLRPLTVGPDGNGPGLVGPEQFHDMIQSVMREVNIPEMAANLAHQLGVVQGPNLSMGQAAQALATHLENRPGVSEPTSQLGKLAAMLASQLQNASNSTMPQQKEPSPSAAAAPPPVSPPTDFSAFERVAREFTAQLFSKPKGGLDAGKGGTKAEEARQGKGKKKDAAHPHPAPPFPRSQPFAFASSFAGGNAPVPDLAQVQAAFQAFMGNAAAGASPLAEFLNPSQGGGPGGAPGNSPPGGFDFANRAQNMFGRAAEAQGGGMPVFAELLAGGAPLNLSDLLGQLGRPGGTATDEEAKRTSKAHPKYRSAKQNKHKIRESGDEHEA
uniref:Transmembrane protein n=1 Tax=Neospora caninum (strain Liverpool) TaxID=572307 RepID=A0A0F7UMS2_NEOCL|nr:TPA: hypothetical protein BN1204_055150 [Neospora caninum Liverpool]